MDSVVDAIRGLVRGEQDKDYLKDFTDDLRGSQSVKSLFDRLSCHWDYLHPEIYSPLIKKLLLVDAPLSKKLSLIDVEQVSDEYLAQWAAFLNQTPLSAFCNIPDIELEKDSDPPPGFVKFVKKLKWEPPPKYLRDVEKLRQKFARKCSLQSCAVTIVGLTIHCLIITMWVPEFIELYIARDLHFIEEQSIVQMVFNGMIIYSQVRLYMQ